MATSAEIEQGARDRLQAVREAVGRTFPGWEACSITEQVRTTAGGYPDPSGPWSFEMGYDVESRAVRPSPLPQLVDRIAVGADGATLLVVRIAIEGPEMRLFLRLAPASAGA